MPSPTIIRGSEQPSIWLLRDHLTPLLGPQHTGGAFAWAIARVHPGDGPPPHVHRREDEAFFVLEGEMTFLYGDSLVHAPAGSFVWVPRDIPHRFQCTSKTPAKQLLFVAPTAFLDFAMTLAQPAPSFDSPPELDEAIVGKLMSVAPTFGIEMLPNHPVPTTQPAVIPPGKRVWAMGEDVTYLATAEQTGGQFTMVDIRTAPGGGPPPHAHTHQNEAFYVIDGTHEFQLGTQTHTLAAGDAVFIPRGVVHRFTNTGATPGRLLDLHTPGGFERFFDDIGIPHKGEASAPTMPPPPPEAIAELLARHGMTLG